MFYQVPKTSELRQSLLGPCFRPRPCLEHDFYVKGFLAFLPRPGWWIMLIHLYLEQNRSLIGRSLFAIRRNSSKLAFSFGHFLSALVVNQTWSRWNHCRIILWYAFEANKIHQKLWGIYILSYVYHIIIIISWNSRSQQKYHMDNLIGWGMALLALVCAVGQSPHTQMYRWI